MSNYPAAPNPAIALSLHTYATGAGPVSWRVRRFCARPVKRKPFFFFLLLSVLVVCGVLSLRFTSGSAGWQIRQVFPGAQPYFDPTYSPDTTISSTIRVVIPSYFGTDESLGFSLHDSPEPLDLRARFSRLDHLHFFSIHFTRCKITNLCPAGSAGFPSIIVFDDCDFSGLPADQRALIRPFDPTDPTATNTFCIGEI